MEKNNNAIASKRCAKVSSNRIALKIFYWNKIEQTYQSWSQIDPTMDLPRWKGKPKDSLQLQYLMNPHLIQLTQSCTLYARIHVSIKSRVFVKTSSVFHERATPSFESPTTFPGSSL